MAKELLLRSHTDSRGELVAIQDECPFPIQRVFYIFKVPNKDITRGGHRHHKSRQLLIAVAGSCSVECDNGVERKTFELNTPRKALLVEAEDFHYMKKFSEDAVLLVLASEPYDKSDYIYEGYPR